MRKFLHAAFVWLFFAFFANINGSFAQTVQVTFTGGFIGVQGTNTNQANNIKTFASLGIARASFEQVDTDGDRLFDNNCGSQGNDICGTIKLYLNSGVVISNTGSLNWRENGGNTITILGFILDANQTASIPYGNNQTYTLVGGTTANTSSTLGFRPYGISWSYVDGDNISGNAATIGLLAALNAQLTSTPQPTAITLASASVNEGGNLIYTATLSPTVSGTQAFNFSFTGTATSTSDYSTSYSFSNGVVNNGDGTITVPNGVSTFSVTVSTLTDYVNEPTETVVLQVGNISATGSIVNNLSPSIVAPAPREYALNQSGQSASGFQLSDFNPSDILLATVGMTQGPTGASLSIITAAGLTLSTGYSSWSNFTRLSFIGTMADINTALASLKVATSNNSANIKIQVTATVNPNGYYYYPLKGHFYQPVTSAGITYTNAKTQAASATYKGQTGYLITITSQDEQDFVFNNVPGNNIWIALSDEANEGIWKIDDGPEFGTTIWTTTQSVTNATTTSYTGGIPAAGVYSNFCLNEPNNSYSNVGEDHAVTKWNGGNCWNDLYKTFPTIGGYVIEFGSWTNPDNQSFTDFYSAIVTNTMPNSGTLTGTQLICVGQSTQFSSDGATGGAWSSTNTSIANVNSSGLVNGVGAGTATITYTIGGSTSSRAITVTAPPTASLSGTQAICSNGTSQLTVTGTSGGTWTSSTPSVATVNSSGLVSGVAAGSATITYTAAGTGGCANAVATSVVTITAPPTASLSGTQAICSNGTSQLTVTGTSGGTWTSSTPSVATVNSSGLVSGVAAGSATITYTAAGTGGCANAVATSVVTITAPPTASLSGTQAICSSGVTQFTVTGASGGTWTSSNSSVATIGTVANTAGGAVEWCVIYDYDAANARYRVGIDLREFNGTGIDPSTVSLLRLFDLWDGPVTFASSDIYWANYYIYTTTQFNYAGSAYASYLRSGNGFYGVKAEFTFVQGAINGIGAGTATITYSTTGTGGCANSTATRTVTVTAPPVAGTLSGTQTVFAGATRTFASTSSGGSWSSSNTSVATVNASTGVVTGVAAGTATITYTVAGTGGCSSASATRSITIYNCPTIPALSSSAYPVCADANFTLTAAGLTGMSSFADGVVFKYSTSPLADPYVGGTVITTVPFASLEVSSTIARATTSLTNGGTYYLYAILDTIPDGAGCRPFATTTLVVNPKGQVNLPSSQVVCSGSSIAAQTLSTSNSGGTTTYAWTNNATSIGLAASGTSVVPSFTAVNTGSVGVTATVSIVPTYTDGGLSCPGAASSYSITVNPVPALSAVSNQVLCNSSTGSINFTNTASGLVNWTNSNTDIGLAASGTGNISFTATNAGPGQISSTITATPTYENAGLSCVGSTISFTVTVNPSGQVNTVSNQVLCVGSPTTAVNFTTANTTTSTLGTQNVTSGTISVAVPDNSAAGITSTLSVNLPTGAIITGMRVTLNVTHTWISDMVINLKAPNGQVLNLFNAHGGSGDNLTNSVVSSAGTATFASGTPPYTGTFAATGASGVGPTGFTSNATSFASLYSTPSGNWSLALRDLALDDFGTLTNWSLSFDYEIPVAYTTYNWVNSNTGVGLAASGTGNIASFTATNAGSTPLTSTITVTPVYTNSGTNCAGTPSTFTYTVNPRVTVDTITNKTFCANALSSVAFTGNATGTTYSWTNSNTAIGLAASGNGDLSFVATNNTAGPISGTVTVTPSFTNGGLTCTGATRTFVIIINPLGQVNAVSSQVICNNASTTAVNFSTVNGGGTVIAGTPVVANSGTLALVVPDGAADGTSHTLPVALPAGATITDVRVNFNMTHTWVSDMSINLKAPNGQILNLVNRRGGSGDNFTNTTISSASTTALTSSSAPFTGTFAADAALNVGPTGQASTATNFAALYSVGTGNWTLWMRDHAAGDIGTLTNWSITINYTTVQGAVTSYTWTNNLPSIGLAASGTGNIASFAALNTSAVPVTATVNVTPTYTNNGVSCAGSPISFTYTVNPTPTVNAVSNQTVCRGSNTAAVTFTGATTGTDYNWTNSNTAIGLAASGTGNIPSFAGTNTSTAAITGTITVTPVYTNAGVTCTGTPRTFTITVNPIPTVNSVANFPVCHNSVASTTFSGASAGTIFSWTNSNPAVGLAGSGTGNISFTAINTTSAPVTATITVTPSFVNGGTTCVGTPTSFVITVNPLPVVTTGTLPARVCISDTLVRLNGTPVGGSWSGFGISGYNFVPPATAVGTWPITYTYADANGCVNRASTTVSVQACTERDRNLENDAVVLYPNPSNGKFNLRINSTLFNTLGMRVYKSNGQLMYVNQWKSLVFGRVIPVDLSRFAAGVYMIRLYYGDGMDRGADRTFKIVISQ